MGAPKVTDKAIQRAITAAQETGIPIGAVVVNNIEGTVRIEVRDQSGVDTPKSAVQPLPKHFGSARQ